MKKAISILLSMIFMLSLCACDTDNSTYSFEKPNYIDDNSNIVFIGNSQLSYYNSPEMFYNLAKQNGKNVTVNTLFIDGSGLSEHCEEIKNDENKQLILAQADVVVMHDYWMNCLSSQYIEEIKGYCKDETKFYFYLTHYNSGVYADVWKYSSEDWRKYWELSGNTLSTSSPYEAWKRYINDEATDEDIKVLSNNILFAPYDAYYTDPDLYYIPEGFTFDRLIFNYDFTLETLIESTDYVHPTVLMSYIDSLIIYRTLFGEVKSDSDKINAYWDYGYEQPKDVYDVIDKAVEESYNEFYDSTAKVFEFKSKYDYIDLVDMYGEK